MTKKRFKEISILLTEARVQKKIVLSEYSFEETRKKLREIEIPEKEAEEFIMFAYNKLFNAIFKK